MTNKSKKPDLEKGEKMKTGATKKLAMKNGKGEIKGYITVYYFEGLGWVTIPDRNDD